jgi:hypothetical protein
MLDFEEFGFKVGPFFVEYKYMFSSLMQDGLKTFVFFYFELQRMVLTKKRGTELETKPLKVRHMSRSTFSNLGLPNSISKTCVFELVCPPRERERPPNPLPTPWTLHTKHPQHIFVNTSTFQIGGKNKPQLEMFTMQC